MSPTAAAGPAPTRGRDRGFTLVEVLVTVASLVIVLGLMASLARSVRRQASERQTKALLLTMSGLLEKYVARHQRLPVVSPFPPPASTSAPDAAVDEFQLREAARSNNRDVVAALRPEAGPAVDVFGPPGVGPPGDDRLPDAWGRDLVFMPRGHPAVGTALEDRPFFFSAGPDGRYQTLEDNLYSYEIAPSVAD